MIRRRVLIVKSRVRKGTTRAWWRGSSSVRSTDLFLLSKYFSSLRRCYLQPSFTFFDFFRRFQRARDVIFNDLYCKDGEDLRKEKRKTKKECLESALEFSRLRANRPGSNFQAFLLYYQLPRVDRYPASACLSLSSFIRRIVSHRVIFRFRIFDVF